MGFSCNHFCYEIRVNIYSCHVSGSIHKRFKFSCGGCCHDSLLLRDETAMGHRIIWKQWPLNLLLLLFLLLSLVNLEFRLFISVSIAQINLVILTFDTSPQPFLLSSLVLFIPFKHCTSQILLWLSSFIQNLMHIAFKIILPVNQFLKIKSISFSSQSKFETLFIDLFLNFLSNQLFDSWIRAAWFISTSARALPSKPSKSKISWNWMNHALNRINFSPEFRSWDFFLKLL